MQVLAVQVPDGMQGGQMLQVQTPAGLMQVQIPDGLEPGMSFQMQVPAVAAPAPAPVPAPTPASVPTLSQPLPPMPSSQSDYLVGEFAQDWASAGRKDALQADVERFKAKRLADAAAAGIDPEEMTLLEKSIDTLGTILTYNFFIIITFFGWFLTGVVAQFGLKEFAIINAFRGAWDWLIMPLLTTHMTLTFLSYGLEKMAGNGEEEFDDKVQDGRRSQASAWKL